VKEESPGRSRPFILVSVLLARGLYALHTYILASTFVLLAIDFSVDITGLGKATAIFLIGLGLFQVPSGILAARLNARDTSIAGLLVLASSAILGGLSPNFNFFLLSRFLSGLGSALYFSPAMAMVSLLYRKSERGLAVGLFWSIFHLGAALTLSAYPIVALTYGWRTSFMIAGAMTLIVAAENFTLLGTVHMEPYSFEPESTWARSIVAVISNKKIWYLTLGLTGLGGAYNSTAQFLIAYLNKHLAYTLPTAGLVASLLPLSGMFGGPIGGFLSDRLGSRKWPLIYSAAAGALTYFLFVMGDSRMAWAAAFMAGFFFSFALSIVFAAVTQYPEIGARHAPLAIALTNSVLILTGSWVPPTFGYLALVATYSIGWSVLALISLGFVTLLFFASEPPFDYLMPLSDHHIRSI
jgi:MFS family permease